MTQKQCRVPGNRSRGSPEPVINTELKIVNEEKPKYSYPVGKRASIILTLQRFAYNVFENSILKSVMTAK